VERLPNRALKILKKVSKGKYFYPHTILVEDEEFYLVNLLNKMNLIEFSLGKGESPYYKNFSITLNGKSMLEVNREKKYR